MKICVIDIGTNSIHALFAEIHANGVFRVLGREKEMVRLGDGAMISGKLTSQTMNAGMKALQRFHHLAKHRGMSRTIAVATSAVRESSNGGQFIDRVREQIGLKIQVITGVEEGRLITLAVQKSVDFSGENRLIVDIGGGSAEFILSNGKDIQWIESLKLGANRLSQIFPLSDSPKKAELNRLESYITSALKPVIKKLKKTSTLMIIGTSGTLLNLASMIVSEKNEKFTFGRQQNIISSDAIKKKYKDLAALKLSDRKKVKGLDLKRADMIIHGSSLIALLMKLSKIPNLITCDKGLREGILYDFIEKNRKRLQIEDKITDIRRRSIYTLAANCACDQRHSEQTAKIALLLFDALKPLHKLKNGERDLLEYAALLHDIGYYLSFDKHHKHAFYLISNADLAGFTLDEITTIAWTARFHRRAAPKKSNLDFAKLPLPSQKTISQLAAILRLADALDHSHFALVKNLKVKLDRSSVKVTVYTSSDIEWEVYEAKQRKELFEKVYGKKIEFQIRKINKG